MTELIHGRQPPRTQPPELTIWFDVVEAEGDATALESECLGRFRDWFVIRATARMTQSFRTALLWVLHGNAAFFSGMPIPKLAAKRSEFLVAFDCDERLLSPLESMIGGVDFQLVANARPRVRVTGFLATVIHACSKALFELTMADEKLGRREGPALVR
jgi:uncharacterized protein YfaT (DUF1175 family)